MKAGKILAIAMAAIVAGVTLTNCGGSKQAVTTPQQKNASSRGAKLEQEECQKLAMEKTNGWRDYGNGVSTKESFAQNIATLDARARLARQLETQINTLIRSFNQQHEADGASSLVSKSSEIQDGYTEKLLTNTKVICSNTYVKEDGSYNVYVCIEMDEEAMSAIRKKLSDDKKLSIDFAEHQFKQEMEKAKEDYRNNNMQ